MLKKFEAAFLLAIVITSFAGIAKLEASCNEVRSEVLRLHVLANSDSEEDQALKLKVRDRILSEGADIFEGALNAEEAKEKIESQIQRLEDIAESEIAMQGYNYKAEVKVCEEYFDTRIYNDITLPAGTYSAVKIVIGEGNGKNWWCVMFPPLCLPAAQDETSIDTVLSEDGLKLVQNGEEYEVRFKIVEVYEKVKNWF